ncbi:MAG: hypothetical protein CM1200mP9_06890 [Gammaproteobacteria bacterium]|nr:MAG: hypothetical protein CM1200mP9_06890 [Gammaproteobacteria bacterium]
MLAFLGFTLFVFFWGEAFFARNILDVRPMFEWMPVLLIFLSSALTMRMWSEERRSGTQEFILTFQRLPGSSFWGSFWGAGRCLDCLVTYITAPDHISDC